MEKEHKPKNAETDFKDRRIQIMLKILHKTRLGPETTPEEEIAEVENKRSIFNSIASLRAKDKKGKPIIDYYSHHIEPKDQPKPSDSKSPQAKPH